MNGLGIILLITACLLILLSTYSFLRAHSHGAIWFGIFLSAVAVYSIGYAFEISSNSLEKVMFWLHIEYLGISFLAPLLILFSLHFCGYALSRNNWFIIFLVIISLFTLFAQLSDPYLHLFYKSATLKKEGNISIIHFSAGVPYWLHQIYSIIGMFVYSWLFFIQALKTKGLHRRQAWMMIAGSIVPWFCYTIYITGNSPARIDLIPFSFIAMGIICAWGMFRYEFFDFAPPDLDKIFKNLNDAIIIFDYKKRITHTNPAAENIFNLSDSKENVLYAETVFANIPDISSTINSTNETSFDFQITRQNETSYFQARISPLQGNRRRVKGKIIVLTDITKRKEAEKILLEHKENLEKLNNTKDLLLSVIGHDLRGLLGNIMNLSSIYVDRYNSLDEPDRLRMIQLIQQGASSTHQFMENLLIWARNQKGELTFIPESLILRDIIENVIKLHHVLSSDKQIMVNNFIPGNICLTADKNLLHTIMRNLLSNAIKFCHQGGIVNIETEPAETEIIIKVSDNGVGIPAEKIPQIFSFSRNRSTRGTANEGGSGLGLVLCREFVEKMNGRIWIESTPGQGSCFFVALPAI